MLLRSHMRTRLQSTNSERETVDVHVTLNIPSLLAKAKTRRIPLQTSHRRSKCKYRQYTCHSCGRSGHIAEACKSKSEKIRRVEEPEPPKEISASGSTDPFSFSLYNLGSGKNGIEIPVQLNGTSLLMELDTGAGVSIISEETFNKHFIGIPLRPSSTRLHTYTGHPVEVAGQFNVHLKYQDQSATLPLLVVEGSGPSLFGRDWLTQVKLYWKMICSIRVSDSDLSEAVRSKLHTAIQSHPKVLQPGLGTIKGITAKLEMKSDAKPKFCKARPVPRPCSSRSSGSRVQPSGIRRHC